MSVCLILQVLFVMNRNSYVCIRRTPDAQIVSAAVRRQRRQIEHRKTCDVLRTGVWSLKRNYPASTPTHSLRGCNQTSVS